MIPTGRAVKTGEGKKGKGMKYSGKAWKFGDHIDTDVIIPARYLTTSDPEVLGRHCLEDADPEFVKKIRPGDIIVAGRNFGCGSSREHAPLAIKAAGISCVIAESFARIFYRNAINMGLPIFESLEAARTIRAGDQVEVDPQSGQIEDRTQKKTFQAEPLPPFIREVIRDGGLIPHIRKQARSRGRTGEKKRQGKKL
jgi:3-isopropylmalate/(R)-2-methylmalate dehydratase small subunit